MFDTVVMAFSFASLPLYVWLLVMLVCHRNDVKLGGAFFYLCVALGEPQHCRIFAGFFDILSLLSFNFLWIMPRKGWFPSLYSEHGVLSYLCGSLTWSVG